MLEIVLRVETSRLKSHKKIHDSQLSLRLSVTIKIYFIQTLVILLSCNHKTNTTNEHDIFTCKGWN